MSVDTAVETERYKVRKDVVSVEGNMAPLETTKFSLDMKNARVMNALANLYEDSELAILREYSANALDAHKAANNSDPILVTLPSVLNHNLVIQDFGVGMSKEEILTVYSVYGYSTKVDDLEQAGAFGFGCKSAFSIADQFFVASVKDGMKTNALISKDTEGVGVISIISHEETDEHTGTTVTIFVPSGSITPFNQASTKLFASWDEGSVKVNDKFPESIFKNARSVTDDVFVSDNAHYNAHYSWRSEGPSLIVGGMLYKVSYSEWSNLSASVSAGISIPKRTNVPHADFIEFLNEAIERFTHKLIIKMPFGTVDFTPSRDSLQYSKRTRQAIIDATINAIDSLFSKIINDLNDDSNESDRFKAYGFWNSFFPYNQFTISYHSPRAWEKMLFPKDHDVFTWQGIKDAAMLNFKISKANAISMHKSHVHSMDFFRLYTAEGKINLFFCDDVKTDISRLQNIRAWALMKTIDETKSRFEALNKLGIILVNNDTEIPEWMKNITNIISKAEADESLVQLKKMRQSKTMPNKAAALRNDPVYESVIVKDLGGVRTAWSDIKRSEISSDAVYIEEMEFSNALSIVDSVRTLMKDKFDSEQQIIFIRKNRTASGLIKHVRGMRSALDHYTDLFKAHSSDLTDDQKMAVILRDISYIDMTIISDKTIDNLMDDDFASLMRAHKDKVNSRLRSSALTARLRHDDNWIPFILRSEEIIKPYLDGMRFLFSNNRYNSSYEKENINNIAVHYFNGVYSENK